VAARDAATPAGEDASVPLRQVAPNIYQRGAAQDHHANEQVP
jgi:hypothetical protein